MSRKEQQNTVRRATSPFTDTRCSLHARLCRIIYLSFFLSLGSARRFLLPGTSVSMFGFGRQRETAKAPVRRDHRGTHPRRPLLGQQPLSRVGPLRAPVPVGAYGSEGRLAPAALLDCHQHERRGRAIRRGGHFLRPKSVGIASHQMRRLGDTEGATQPPIDFSPSTSGGRTNGPPTGSYPTCPLSV